MKTMAYLVLYIFINTCHSYEHSSQMICNKLIFFSQIIVYKLVRFLIILSIYSKIYSIVKNARVKINCMKAGTKKPSDFINNVRKSK